MTRAVALVLAALVWVPLAGAALRVDDDAGRALALATPARRVVSLAPHLTELAYAAGGGARLVAAVEHSDYPEAAQRLPRVGSSHHLDLEAILAQRPELVLAWGSGSPGAALARLESLGVPVFTLELRRVDDLPAALARLGRLLGSEDAARAAARRYAARAAALRARYAARPRVRVFYQILDEALYTVNGAHLISDVLRLCGADNVFADLPTLAARIDLEALLRADPQAIVAGGDESLWTTWQARWQRWPQLAAVANSRLYHVPADLLHRPGPRILDGAERVCTQLDSVRLTTRNSKPGTRN